MTNRFDSGNKNRLDSPKRREALPPYEILRKLGLQEGTVVADIGCGIGYFSIPAADIVGSKGLVYAMDIELEMVEETERRAAEYGMINIRPIVTGEYDLKIEDSMVSFAFICLVLHEVSDRIRLLYEAKRILKNDGKLVVIEWRKKESDWGPPEEQRLDAGEIKELLISCGFAEAVETEISSDFLAITALK